MALIEQGGLYDAFTDTFSGMELITLENALELIEDTPTIDAVPVVHGHILDNGNPICGPCSACGESVNRRARYCSMCGARMDGGEGHEN